MKTFSRPLPFTLALLMATTVLVFIGLVLQSLWPGLQSALQAQVTNRKTKTIQNLYSGKLQAGACDLVGPENCAQLDASARPRVEKTIRLERFVTGSGYLAWYYKDRRPVPLSALGGFGGDSVVFVTNSGDRIPIENGLQVFERGTVEVEFLQAYTPDARLALDADFELYFLPHSSAVREGFLALVRDNPDTFGDYKQERQRDIQELCKVLTGGEKLPTSCAPVTPVSSDNNTSLNFDPDFGAQTDPSTFPELNFAGDSLLPPMVEFPSDTVLAFKGQPVSIAPSKLFDPDGKCQLYAFTWQKQAALQVSEFKIDPRLGDLFFVPNNTGAFTLSFTVKEKCGSELGQLSSAPELIRLIVRDKNLDFRDLNQAPGFQNYFYDLYSLGVVQGYSDGSMKPRRLINRAEFLKTVFETLKYDIPNDMYSARYPDVTPQDWFAPYVWQADRLGVIKGYQDGRFHPGRTINLAEAIKIVLQFTSLEVKDSTEFVFGDVDYRDWYSRYIQTAYREGILEDIEPGSNVFPGKALNRAEAFKIIVKTFLFPVNRLNQVNKDVTRRLFEFEDFSTFTPKTVE